MFLSSITIGERRQALLQSLNNLQQVLVPILKGFQKLPGLTIFRRFFRKVSSAFWESLKRVVVAFGNFS